MAPAAAETLTVTFPDDSSTAAAPSHYGHKPLAPLRDNDIALFVVVAVALFIASGAGVGGGALFVPDLGAAAFAYLTRSAVCLLTCV